MSQSQFVDPRVSRAKFDREIAEYHVKGVRRDFVAGKMRQGQGGSAHGVRGADGGVVGGAHSTQY